MLLTMAWRNLWRNYRRSLIMLLAIAVGAWAMIFLSSFMRSMLDNMVSGGLEGFTGHLQVQHQDYRDDPSVANLIPAPNEQLVQYLDKTGRWSTRIRVPAVIASERESRGATLLGVNPDKERQLSFVAEAIVQGRWLTGEGDDGLIIGQRLARTLQTRLGRRVVLSSQDRDNELVERGFRIVGIYKADLASLEDQFVLTGLKTSERLLGVSGLVSEVEWQGMDFRSSDSNALELNRLVSSPQVVRSWKTLQPLLYSMTGLMEGFLWLWALVVLVLLGLGLVNTFAMAVFERQRELGLLQALGLSPPQISSLLLIEALCLIGLGLLLGDLLAWLSVGGLASGLDLSRFALGLEELGASPVFYLRWHWSDVILAQCLTLVLGLGSTLLPAMRAAQLDPVRALTRL